MLSGRVTSLKERIMMAAAQELNERGVRFTVDAVAEKLGISKKTLYQYYRSKDELIADIVQAALEDCTAQQEAILASDRDFAAKLAGILTITPQLFGKINDWVYADLQRYRPAEWAKIEEYRRSCGIDTRLLLDQGVAAGYLRPVNTAVAARMLRGSVTEMMNYDFLAEANLTFTDALRASTDVILRGLLRDTGDGE